MNVMYCSSMTKPELHNAILQEVKGHHPLSIGTVVDKAAELPGVEKSEARSAVERLVDNGKLQLDANMHLEVPAFE